MHSLLLSVLLLLGGSASTSQVGPVVAEVVVEGGVTVDSDTASYYLGIEPGDRYDEAAVVKGFRRLWKTGLFEELRIEKETLPDGKVRLIVVVKERPIVRSVIFEGNDKLSTTKLRDALDEKGIDLPRKVPLKLGELEKIRSALVEIYNENGYRSAQIEYKIEKVSTTERRVVFVIDEGGKVKIEKIEFVGNEVFSDRRLRRALKKLKQAAWYRPWGKKLIYTEEAWSEDQENLRNFYLNHGYKDVKIGTPTIEMYAKKPQAKELKKKKFRLKITIPVEEGKRYRIGSVKVHGTEVFKPEKLEKLFRPLEGKWYSRKRVEEGMEAIRNLYHNRGYIYAYTTEVLTDREGEEGVVDVTVEVYEGKRFRLGRLEFEGNTKTRDKVLRREFLIGEGDWMNMGLFRRSVYKVNALGYWKLEENPLTFSFDEERNRVSVKVKGIEVGRNDLQFGAGYSELDGFFAQMMFNTRNFMGRGETLGISLQTGRRADYYTLTFIEPYFMDRRILVGGSIFKTNLDIADFYRETKGGSITLGFGLGSFDSITVLLAYEDVYSRFVVVKTGSVGDPTDGHHRPIDLPPEEWEPEERTYEVFTGKTAAVTPAYAYDSRDDPFDPNRGIRFVFRTRFAGGPLGGDFDYVRPEAQFSLFKPMSRKWIFAFNVEGGQFFTYSGSSIPIYERYRLGGDRSLRGIPYYTVVPRTKDGEYFLSEGGSRLGGDRYWLANFELQFKLGGPVKLVLFTDLGNTYFDTQGWDFSLFRKTAGVELRVFVPIFQAPLRFIYGINLDPFPEERSSDFEFSIGTTF